METSSFVTRLVVNTQLIVSHIRQDSDATVVCTRTAPFTILPRCAPRDRSYLILYFIIHLKSWPSTMCPEAIPLSPEGLGFLTYKRTFRRFCLFKRYIIYHNLRTATIYPSIVAKEKMIRIIITLHNGTSYIGSIVKNITCVEWKFCPVLLGISPKTLNTHTHPTLASFKKSTNRNGHRSCLGHAFSKSNFIANDKATWRICIENLKKTFKSLKKPQFSE